MSVWGAAKKGFGRALRAHRIKHGKRGKTITGVKPLSGKVPWYVGAGGKNPGKRAGIVKTYFQVKKTEQIDKLEKQIKEGKKGLKKMVDTGQAREMKDYKGKGTGKHFRTGSR
jgi:hypothetical protein